MKRWPACAAVLAGGASSRFGSNKALATLGGRTLLAHALGALLPRFERVAFVVKQGDARLRELQLAAASAAAESYEAGVRAQGGDALVEGLFDLHAAPTPLSGLHAALAWAPCEWLFCVAVDMPFAADDALLAALFAAGRGRDAAAPEHGGSVQPLAALWRKQPCLPVAQSLLAKGAGPSALLDGVRTALVPWSSERPFLDADTPDALRSLRGR